MEPGFSSEMQGLPGRRREGNASLRASFPPLPSLERPVILDSYPENLELTGVSSPSDAGGAAGFSFECVGTSAPLAVLRGRRTVERSAEAPEPGVHPGEAELADGPCRTHEGIRSTQMLIGSRCNGVFRMPENQNRRPSVSRMMMLLPEGF